jgi:glycine hydroxymethyltransferase
MDATRWFESDRESVFEEVRRREAWRQWRTLILIPSESLCIPPASKLLDSEFGNLYAEGYPQLVLDNHPHETALDPERFEGWQRRLADRRYYKGCVQVNRVELLAQRFVAEAFARLPGSPPAARIYANVQALSGAPANTAVYEALMEPGAVLMGMKLNHGGHLTHGSSVNISGRRHRIVSYAVDPKTRRLDYDAIEALAREHRPRVIIGGSSAYPWDFDWPRLRKIADAAGAFLLADIAHLAGMVVAGVLSNPLPHADVVTFTTHKALAGPRGAVILSRRKELMDKINLAVFPGLQGGPHMNSIAAIGRLFELIVQNREGYVAYQRGVIENTGHLARALEKRGFALEYGGTDTHLLLIDLKRWKPPGAEKQPIDGEIASRLLELAGIVVNKNTIPGDEGAGQSSAVRLGMPWLTQRGITPAQIDRLAEAIHAVLSQVHTTRVWVPGNQQRCRARVPFDVLERARAITLEIAEGLRFPARPPEPAAARPAPGRAAHVALRLRGEKTEAALQQMLTCDLTGLATGDARAGLFLRSDGTVLEKAAVIAEGRHGRDERFVVVVPAAGAAEVRAWLEGLSDGYLLFDPHDLYAKVDGPTVIEDVEDAGALVARAAPLLDPLPAFTGARADARALVRSHPKLFALAKTYFIGQKAVYAAAPPPAKEGYRYAAPTLPVRKTVLNALHRQLGAKMVDFAGWDMPLQYPAGIFREHRAVRTAAGLFDVSHMGVFEIKGRGATSFLETALANSVRRMGPGQASYNYLLYPDGIAADDTYLYRLALDRWLLVVNAANAERDWDWLQALNSRRFVIDPEMPGKQIEDPVELRNLRDAGADSLVDLALQGPLSQRLLMKLAATPEDRARIERCIMNEVVHVKLGGAQVIAARTGYTGERIGFELFPHPDAAVGLFQALLEAGAADGVLPTGLGARDAARTEAGFPLFGHELEGDHHGTLTESGYGFVPRFHVPFFVGRDAYIRRVTPQRRKLVRMRGQGKKSVRPGHLILNDAREPAGVVTSFAYLDEELNFVALAFVDVGLPAESGRKLTGLREKEYPGKEALDADRLVELTALPRFPNESEREGWLARYRRAGAPAAAAAPAVAAAR